MSLHSKTVLQGRRGSRLTKVFVKTTYVVAVFVEMWVSNMAIYHLSMDVVGRGNSGPKCAKLGKSIVAMAAYRAAEKMIDERTETTYDYTKKSGVEYCEIYAPENSPEWVYERQKLWNEVEKIETRKNAQLGREMDIALPVELTHEEHREIVKKYVENNFTSKGIIADVAYHNADKKNPHVHILLTRREITPDGFGQVSKEWYGGEFKGRPGEEQREYFKNIREDWAVKVNDYFELKDLEMRIDHRSLEEQGIERVPQIHLGPSAHAMEKKGIETIKGNLLKEILEFNRTKIVQLEEYKRLKDELLKAISTKEQIKKYKPKNMDSSIKLSFFKDYADYYARKYIDMDGCRALFRLNSYFGKKVTIDFIYKTFNILKSLNQLDRALKDEIEALSKGTATLLEIKNLTDKKQELKSNPISSLVNFNEIKSINTKIVELKKELNFLGFRDKKEHEEKSLELDKTKANIEKMKEDKEVITEAKKALDKAEARQKEVVRNKSAKKQRHKFMKRRKHMGR